MSNGLITPDLEEKLKKLTDTSIQAPETQIDSDLESKLLALTEQTKYAEEQQPPTAGATGTEESLEQKLMRITYPEGQPATTISAAPKESLWQKVKYAIGLEEEDKFTYEDVERAAALQGKEIAPTTEYEKAKVMGVSLPTGKVILPSGEIEHDIGTGLTTAVISGAARGVTLGIPENLMRLVGKEEWATYYPETKADQISYAVGNLVGFVGSPIVKAFNKAFSSLTSKVISSETIGKVGYKFGAKGASGIKFLKEFVDNATTMATAFAVQTPIIDKKDEYLKEVLNNAINGATVASVFQTVSLINPKLIEFVSPEGSKLITAINKKSSPFLFSVFRAGTAAAADSLLFSEQAQQPDLVDRIFNIGITAYFGAKSQFLPAEAIAAQVHQETARDIKKILKEMPEVVKAAKELEIKSRDSANTYLSADAEDQPFPKKIKILVKKTPKTSTEEPQYEVKEVDKYYGYQTNYNRKSEELGTLEKRNFLDMDTEKESYWDNHRKEAEKLTPDRNKIVILNALKKRIKVAKDAVARSHNIEEEKIGSVYNLFSYNLKGGDSYAVNIFPERTLAIKGDKLTSQQVEDFICRNIDILSNPLFSIRTQKGKDGHIILDIVRTFKNKDVAINIAKEYQQESIYYLGKKTKDKTGKVVASNAEKIDVNLEAINSSSENLPTTPIQQRHLLKTEGKQIVEVFHFSSFIDDNIGWFTPQAMGLSKTNREISRVFYHKDRNAGLLPGQLPFLTFYTRTSPTIEPHLNIGKSLYRTEIALDDLFIAESGKALPSSQKLIKQGKLGVYFPGTGEVWLYTPINAVKVVDKFTDINWQSKQTYSGETLVDYLNTEVLKPTGKIVDDFNLRNISGLENASNVLSVIQQVKNGELDSDTAYEEFLKKSKSVDDLKNRLLQVFKCPVCKKLTAPGDTCPHCGADIKTFSDNWKFYIDKLNKANPKETNKIIEDLTNTDDPAYQEQFLFDAGFIKDKQLKIPAGEIDGGKIKLFLIKPRRGGVMRIGVEGEIFDKLPADASLDDVLKLLPPDMPVTISGAGERAVRYTAKELQDLVAQKDGGMGAFVPAVHYFTKKGIAFRDIYLTALDGVDAYNKLVRRADKVIIPEMKKLTPKEQEDLLIYYYWQQADVRPTLQKAYGINEAPKLNEKQLNIDKLLRSEFDGWLKSINTAREIQGLAPITGVENYFPIMRDISSDGLLLNALFNEPDPVRIRIAFQNIRDPFLIERTPNIEPIKFNLVEIYSKYVQKTGRYVANAEFLAKTKLLLRPISLIVNGSLKTYNLQTEKPNMFTELQRYQQRVAFRVVPDFIGYMQSDPKNPFIKTAALIINKNLAAATLACNLRSALIQPTAIINLTLLFPSTDIAWAMKAVLNPKNRQLINDLSKHLLNRKFDVVQDSLQKEVPDLFGDGNALRRICNKGLKGWLEVSEKVSEIGLYPLKELDFITAQIGALTAYRNGIKRGLGGKELQRFIDESLIKTQISGSFMDVSKAQLGELPKLFSLFQTFTIGQINLAYNELIKPALHPKTGWNKEYFRKVIRFGLWSILLNILYEDVLKLRSPLPTPEREIVKLFKGEQNFVKTTFNTAKELAEQIPYIGASARWSTPYRAVEPTPVLQIWTDTWRTMSKLTATQSFKNFKIEDYTLLPRWLGVPGTSQFEKSYRRYMQGASWEEIVLGIKPEEVSGIKAKQRATTREWKRKRVSK